MEKIKEFIDEKKFIIIGGLFIVLFIMIGFVFCYFYFESDDDNVLLNEPLVKEEEKEEIKEEESIINYFYVDVKGEVKKPGTYKIEEGKRVIDAITLAGGLTKSADTSANNLSMKVKDEMVIIIYSDSEIKDFETVKEKETLVISNCNKENNNIVNDSCISDNLTSEDSSKSNNNSLVSINTASKEELMTISGIGESKAIAIIEYRDQNGLFSDISDIKNVSGIGDSLYEKIKDYITT